MEVRSETPPENIVPDAPGFTGCVAHFAAFYAKAGGSRPSVGVLRERCAALWARLLRADLRRLIAREWVLGGARELGVGVSVGEVRRGLENDLVRQFGSEAKFQKFLAESGENMPDLLFGEEYRLLSDKIREKIEPASVSEAQVARDYSENKRQYFVAEKRDLGLIETKSAAAARRVKRELESGVAFASIAKRRAGEQPPYTRGGLLLGLEPHAFAERSLNGAIFRAGPHVVEGPVRVLEPAGWKGRSLQDIHAIDGYYVFRVQSVSRAYQQPLVRVRATIAQLLLLAMDRRAIAAYIKPWRERWLAKTDCSPGFVIRKCRQYQPLAGEEPEDAYTLD